MTTFRKQNIVYSKKEFYFDTYLTSLHFNVMWMLVFLWRVHLCLCAFSQRSEKGVGSQELELQADVDTTN